MIRVPALRLIALLLILEEVAVSVATAQEAKPADFMKDGLGFVQKHCVGCHGEKKPKAGLALHGFRDESAVIKERKVWQNLLAQVRSGEMPPPERPRPTAAEIEAFSRAVGEALARADRNAKPDPGRVTIRRLNRTEYDNTIRDLVGVDFQPSEDFPSDDVGHGFDNIGDVLTLSPVLMERYLAAAESIMQRAIVPDPPKPPVRHVSARYTEPAGAHVPQTLFRPVTSKGMLHSLYQLTMDGDYTFRVRAYAKQVGNEPVHIALNADGKELKQFDVTATTEKDAQVFEAKLPLLKGGRRMGVTFLNEFKNDKEQRTLFVEYLELTGPADTRPPSQARLLACDTTKAKAEQTRLVLARFASKAYRHPATPAEIERLAKLAEGAEARGEKWEAGIQLAMQAVLVSPKFLFRVELDHRPDTAEPHPLDEYQLAARLSYFLWSSMPDDELFDLAGKKALTANLDAQVRRMLKDPKADALVENFALQWLQLRRLKTFAPDPKLFPTFDEPLRQAMLRETELFFQAIMREDRSILDLIDADYTYLNERLAHHYGIGDTNGTWAGQKPSKPGGQPIRGEQFVRVSLPGKERGGLLTQASILTVTSNPTRTSPVKRGRWVLEQLLGTPPPPPPPNVPELAETEKAVLSGSLRQRMEQHRVNPNCASCHARMDPIGFAFENYNAVGAFRLKDGDFPIDPAGTLPDGRSFKGPAELKAILKEKKDLVSRCLTEKMLIYALGRGLEYYDRPSLDRITMALARNEYRFSTLVTEIVRSDPFRLRRGKDGLK
jgi:mono/diheme cytochrome c family protein